MSSRGLNAFDSDGFTLGAEVQDILGSCNVSGSTYASWSWRGSDSSAVSNTDGSITSTVSANTTSGFSIVKWTGDGATSGVGHGLGVAPKIVIYKKLNGASDWYYWTTQIDGSNDDLRLNTTATKSDLSGTSGSITSSTISNYNWGSSDNMIAYCFAEKKGFSKFGSYTGNGSTDGTFLYTGFKPAWVMIKRTNSTTPWCMWDNKRNTFNVTQNYLYANGSDAEGSGAGLDIDMLSNGFKLKSTSSFLNTSGDSFIYMAFAESPLVGTNNIPATAR